MPAESTTTIDRYQTENAALKLAIYESVQNLTKHQDRPGFPGADGSAPSGSGAPPAPGLVAMTAAALTQPPLGAPPPFGVPGPMAPPRGAPGGLAPPPPDFPGFGHMPGVPGGGMPPGLPPGMPPMPPMPPMPGLMPPQMPGGMPSQAAMLMAQQQAQRQQAASAMLGVAAGAPPQCVPPASPLSEGDSRAGPAPFRFGLPPPGARSMFAPPPPMAMPGAVPPFSVGAGLHGPFGGAGGPPRGPPPMGGDGGGGGEAM